MSSELRTASHRLALTCPGDMQLKCPKKPFKPSSSIICYSAHIIKCCWSAYLWLLRAPGTMSDHKDHVTLCPQCPLLSHPPFPLPCTSMSLTHISTTWIAHFHCLFLGLPASPSTSIDTRTTLPKDDKFHVFCMKLPMDF